VAPSSVRAPSGRLRSADSVALAALDANSVPSCAVVIQQVAACPAGTFLSWVSFPSGAMLKVATVLVPASATAK